MRRHRRTANGTSTGDEHATMTRDGVATAQPTDSLSTYRAKRSPDTSPEPVGHRVAGPGAPVRRPQARRPPSALRPAPRDGRRPAVVGGAEGPVVRHGRQAARRQGRGSPARVRRLRGDHSRRATTAPAASSSGTAASGSPLEDWREGLEKGKLLFELRGYKLHGKWTLVKIKKSEKDWLLIKERDACVKSPGDQFPETSVLSGLTVEEVKAGAATGPTRCALRSRPTDAPAHARRSAPRRR